MGTMSSFLLSSWGIRHIGLAADPNAVVVDLGADHRLEEKPRGMSSTVTSMSTGLTAWSLLPAYPKMAHTGNVGSD